MAISFCDADNGWMLELPEGRYRTTDGGGSWQRTGYTVFDWFYDIVATDPSHAVIVGGGGAMLRTTNGGTRWVGAGAGGGFNTAMRGVAAVDSMLLSAVGSQGRIVVTNDGGQGWAARTGASTADLMDVVCLGEATTIVVGCDGAIQRSDDSSRTWHLQPVETRRQLNAVAMRPDGVGLAVGEGGTILRTTSGGYVLGTEQPPAAHAAVHIGPNHPNPVHSLTTLRFEVAGSGPVVVRVHDMLGREVARLMDADRAAGVHAVQWDARGLPPGVYVAVLQAGRQRLVHPMVVVH
jgi:hypothetical protein